MADVVSRHAFDLHMLPTWRIRYHVIMGASSRQLGGDGAALSTFAYIMLNQMMQEMTSQVWDTCNNLVFVVIDRPGCDKSVLHFTRCFNRANKLLYIYKIIIFIIPLIFCSISMRLVKRIYYDAFFLDFLGLKRIPIY